MIKQISTYFDKLFFKKWTVGIVAERIEDVIKKRTFEGEIKWIDLKTNKKFLADPFFLPETKSDNLKILLEDFSITDNYGKISMIELDSKLEIKENNILLDTSTHLSYPFIFKEYERIFIFPESGNQKKLSCYEYISETKTLQFVKDIINLPLFDSTIFRHENKYWLFGVLMDAEGTNYELNVYFADSLLGNYRPHLKNPIKLGLNGTRSAGDFIVTEGEIYRPSQNCQNTYGESITIFKITELNEETFSEVPYMTISPDQFSRRRNRITKIHTINSQVGFILIDGMVHVFAPWLQLKNSIKYRFRNREK